MVNLDTEKRYDYILHALQIPIQLHWPKPNLILNLQKKLKCRGMKFQVPALSPWVRGRTNILILKWHNFKTQELWG